MSQFSDLFNNQEYDPSTHESQDDFPVCPPGKYPALIDKAELKQTKKLTGHYIRLEMTIMDGPHKGRKLFDQINIDNPSAQCVEIGMKELTALVKAVGLQGEDWKNLDLYVNQVVVAHVKVKGEQNEVRTYSSASGAAVAPAVASAPVPVTPRAPATAPAPSPNGAGKLPWK